MAATYHKLNKQEFIIQLGTCASGTLASGGELSGYAALEGELVYVPDYKAVYVGDSSYYLRPSHGTHIACSAITATTVDATNVYATTVTATNITATSVHATTVTATNGSFTTLTGAAWEDIRVAGLSMRTNATAPDLVDIGGGILTYGFDGGGLIEQCYAAIQVPHSYKVGTNLHPHVHYMKATAVTGAIVWAIDYTLADIGEAFPAATRLSATGDPGAVSEHSYLDLGDINGSSLTGVSSMLMFRLFRPSTDSHDTYTGDAYLLEFDLHYEVDSLGSDAETTKSF
jgi:hypothetical protein